VHARALEPLGDEGVLAREAVGVPPVAVPMSIGPTLLPVYEASEYARSKTTLRAASLSMLGERSCGLPA